MMQEDMFYFQKCEILIYLCFLVLKKRFESSTVKEIFKFCKLYYVLHLG